MRSLWTAVKQHNPVCSVSGLVKIDMLAKAGAPVAGKIDMPHGNIVGEPFFVHRDPQALIKGSAAVDDGFLILYCTDAAKGTSSCKVWSWQAQGASNVSA
jgi:carotenoid cleavage dioxygenase-like enzyme